MLVKFITSRKTFIWFIIFLGFVVGAFSFVNIPKENNPSTNLPMFIVNTFYYGGDPVTIEKQISKKLEDEFKSISGIKKIESVSSFHVSTLIVNFYDNKDIVEAKSDLKDSIDKVYISFPENVIKPIIKQVSPDDTPVYSFSVVGDYLSKILYAKSEELEDELKTVPGVSDVIIIGKPDKKVNVYLDYEKINKFGINAGDVANLLSNIFINQPVDKKDIGGSLYSYEIATYNKNIDDIIATLENTDILNVNSQSIKLKNIADVYYEEVTYKEKSYLLVDDKLTNSITFDIKISPGSDVEGVIKNILSITEKFAENNPDLKVYETFSKLVEIKDTFYTFVSNFRQTGLIVMVILFLFIGVRISMGVTIAFPLVYLITFIYLSVLGYTFNTVVSFALVLTLGIMVDNLIVITEGVVDELKKGGKINYWDAVNETFKKFIGSILPGTLITVFMFLPIIFMLSGVIGQFIGPISITIAGTLLTSLFVSIIILPVILGKILPKDVVHGGGIMTKVLDRISIKLSSFTKKLLETKRSSILIIILFWVLLFFSFFLVGQGIVKTDFLPSTDQDNIWINIKYPTGYSINQNQKITQEILDDTDKFFDERYPGVVDFISVNIGNLYSTSPITAASNPTADNQAYLNIKLVSGDLREIKSYEISESLSDYINNVIKVKYSMLSDIYAIAGMSMSGGKAVGFYIIGDDINEISEYVNKIYPEIEAINGAYNLSTNLEYTNGKIRYLIDFNKAVRNKVPLGGVVNLFASLKNSDYVPNGIPLKTFNEIGDDPINLVMYTNYNGDIENVKIGDNFVSKVTKQRTIESELKNIQHIDGKLQIVIEADKKADVALGAITEKIDKVIQDNPLPKGLSFRYNAALEDQTQSSIDLGKALGTGAILMFLILLFKFNSFKYSLIILTSNILSFIGVITALGITGLPLSFPAQLGLFGVIGVGVNNAILFIDAYLRKERKHIKRDLIQTIRDRFTAIFLTSSTTIAGLITLALKDELWGGLAIAFIGGLLLNVLMVVVYLPSIIYVIDKKKK